MEKISKHITYKEATKSRTAQKRGIDNTPNEEQLDSMKRIAEKIFEPLREGLGGNPIAITSFFRGKTLNSVIGGSNTSQHVRGEAMDIDADVFGYSSNKEIFNYIRENLTFDQLLWEFGDDNNPAWVHVSLKENHNRGMCLKVTRNNGKTNYTLI